MPQDDDDGGACCGCLFLIVFAILAVTAAIRLWRWALFDVPTGL